MPPSSAAGARMSTWSATTAPPSTAPVINHGDVETAKATEFDVSDDVGVLHQAFREQQQQRNLQQHQQQQQQQQQHLSSLQHRHTASLRIIRQLACYDRPSNLLVRCLELQGVQPSRDKTRPVDAAVASSEAAAAGTASAAAATKGGEGGVAEALLPLANDHDTHVGVMQLLRDRFKSVRFVMMVGC